MKQFVERAQELFEKNPDVEQYYFTSDGNAFVSLVYADNFAQGFKTDAERKVVKISRGMMELVKKVEGTPIADQLKDIAGVVVSAKPSSNVPQPENLEQSIIDNAAAVEAGNKLLNPTVDAAEADETTQGESPAVEKPVDAKTEKKNLQAKYSELYGKNAPFNWNAEKLVEMIAAKS